MNENYKAMREEWFNKTQLNQPTMKAIIEKQAELIRELRCQPQTANSNNRYILYWENIKKLESELSALQSLQKQRVTSEKLLCPYCKSHPIKESKAVVKENLTTEKRTAEEILLNIIPKDCYWEEMRNLTNTPINYILEAMEEYKREGLPTDEEINREFPERKDSGSYLEYNVARIEGAKWVIGKLK